MIDVGAGGAWNEKIREISNVLYEPWDTGREYKIWYSAYSGAYVAATLPVIGYAYSSDGITWTQVECTGVAPDGAHGAEDPYIVKIGNTYYMYFELRDGTTIHQISRAYSTDCEAWTYEQVVLSAQGAGWEEGDVASPIVWNEGTTWYMIYEGRAMPGLDPATIGMGESVDGLTWTGRAQILGLGPGGKFDDEQVVPHDIIKIGSTYYLFYAGHDGVNFQQGLQSTDNFIAWNRLNGGDPIREGRGNDSVCYNGSVYVFFYYEGAADDGGILRGYADAGESVSLGGLCETDFRDLRFRHGVAELDYWIEENTDSSHAIIWVTVPTILVGPNLSTIYIYFGHTGLATTSDGDATFPKLFDDFEDGIVGNIPAGYNIIAGDGGDTLEVANDQAYLGVQSAKLEEDGGITSGKFRTDDLDGYTGAVIHHMFRYLTADEDSGVVRVHDEGINEITLFSCSGTTAKWRYKDNTGWHDVPNLSAPAHNTWYRIEVFLRFSDKKVKFIKDRDEDSGWLNSIEAWATLDYDGFHGVKDNPTTAWYDNVYMRKFIDPEPTHGAWGPRESIVWPF